MSTIVSPMAPGTRIYIAGHRGLVGSALWRHFSSRGFGNLIGVDSADLDLRDARSTADFLAEVRPDVVINAAAKVGGILANSTKPAEFLSDNLHIQANLLGAAVANGVKRFLFLGSSCIYPKFADQPIREEALHTGPLETTNQAFAIAKLAGVAHVAAIRQQYGLPFISAMPTNLYGPGDNFHPQDSHVLPSMLRRFHEAARDGQLQVICWGTGRPRREFLYIDDLADACHFLLDNYDGDSPVNVGTGRDVGVVELAELIADVTGFRGEIVWDTSKPDGTYRKLLDVSRLESMGWKATTPLSDGIRAMYAWFVEHESDYRG